MTDEEWQTVLPAAQQWAENLWVCDQDGNRYSWERRMDYVKRYAEEMLAHGDLRAAVMALRPRLATSVFSHA